MDGPVSGEFPEHLTRVRQYGTAGATLIPRPDAVWEHPRSEALEWDDGPYAVTLQLWTAEESPSDLSAELEITQTES